MNQHPIVLLYPLFKWLNYAVAEYGLYLYMATRLVVTVAHCVDFEWRLLAQTCATPAAHEAVTVTQAPYGQAATAAGNGFTVRRMTASLSPLELP